MAIHIFHKGLKDVREKLTKYAKSSPEFHKTLDDFDELRHGLLTVLEHDDIKKVRESLKIAFGEEISGRFDKTVEHLEELKSLHYDIHEAKRLEKLPDFVDRLDKVVDNLDKIMSHEAYDRLLKEIEQLEELKDVIEKVRGIVE